MKRTTFLSLAALVVAGAFFVSPLVGLYGLAAAVKARDAAALDARVDFRRLRLSLSRQVIETYLQISGRSAKLGKFGRALAIGTGVSMADPIIAGLVNPQTLVTFLNSAHVSTGGLELSGRGPMQNGNLGPVWKALVNSEFGIANFHISLPTSAPPAEQYRLRLQLLQWTWKLTEVDLPHKVRVQLANELKKRIGS